MLYFTNKFSCIKGKELNIFASNFVFLCDEKVLAIQYNLLTYLTEPSEVAGTNRLTGITISVCWFKTAIFRLISPSLRGALTVAEPR